jgi:hypothetical protein
MNLVTATLLWKNGYFFGRSVTPYALNCALLTESARVAYLFPPTPECSQDEYTLSFANPKKDPNVLTGIFVVENGVGMVLDLATVKELTDGCSACCDAQVALKSVYNGILPVRIAPLAATYTVVRADSGSYLDSERFQIDYMAFIIPNSFQKGANDGTNTTYTFKAYKDPLKVGTDTITETARVFQSNDTASVTLGAGEVYNLTGNADGKAVHVKGAANTLTALLTAIQADAVTGPLGTWSIVSNKIQLSSTSVNAAGLVLGHEAA